MNKTKDEQIISLRAQLASQTDESEAVLTATDAWRDRALKAESELVEARRELAEANEAVKGLREALEKIADNPCSWEEVETTAREALATSAPAKSEESCSECGGRKWIAKYSNNGGRNPQTWTVPCPKCHKPAKNNPNL
jgi:predicted  nucleic acid-binding Zn-ribbon protein